MNTNGLNFFFRSRIKKSSFLLIFLFLNLLCLSDTFADSYIVFRYDDFAADLPQARTADSIREQVWQVEQQMDALFEKYDMPYVVGIIPRAKRGYLQSDSTMSAQQFATLNNDPEKAEFLKQGIQAGRIEIAQHGFTHADHLTQSRRRSEFIGRTFQQQLDDIQEGRDILCQALDLEKVNVFIPPFNSWDGNTGLALKQAGFEVLSAAFYDCYDQANTLKHAPFTIEPHCLGELLDETIPDRAVIVVMCHPYTFIPMEDQKENCIGIEQFGNMLEKISNREDLAVVSFEQLTERVSLDYRRFKSANSIVKNRCRWSRFFPQYKPAEPPFGGYYLDRQAYQRLRYQWSAFTVGAVMLGGLIGMFLCRLLKNNLIAVIAVLPVMGGIIVKMHRIRSDGFYVSIELCILLAFCVGFLLSFLMIKFCPERAKEKDKTE